MRIIALLVWFVAVYCEVVTLPDGSTDCRCYTEAEQAGAPEIARPSRD